MAEFVLRQALWLYSDDVINKAGRFRAESTSMTRPFNCDVAAVERVSSWLCILR
jgi:hypothetical protein